MNMWRFSYPTFPTHQVLKLASIRDPVAPPTREREFLEVRSYNLLLDLDFKKLKFDGNVTIQLDSEGDVSLDSAGLEILKVSSDGKPLAHRLVGEELRVQTGPFSGKLEIQYRGAVSEKLTGLYKATYPGGYVFSTQFEAASARKLLPCFDRPECKAEFAL